MAEPRFKSPPPPSHIPVMSPRRSETISSLPSSLNVPNLGLVPPNRRPSGSAGSSSLSFQSAPPVASPNTGFNSLRNLRNFLPFGNTKSQTPSGSTNGYGINSNGSGSTTKKSLAGLGAVRRSMAVDRKPSWTTSTSGDGSQSGEQDEVMVIDHSREGRSASEGSEVSLGIGLSLSPPAPPPKDLGTSLSPLINLSLFSLFFTRSHKGDGLALLRSCPVQDGRVVFLSVRTLAGKPPFSLPYHLAQSLVLLRHSHRKEQPNHGVCKAIWFLTYNLHFRERHAPNTSR